MRGLLRKDFYTLKGTLGILMAFMLFYAVLGYIGHNSSMVTSMAAVVVMMIPVNSIAFDEGYHWNRYVLTAPVSRQMVVQSKYLLSVLLSGFTLLVGTAFSLLLGEPLVDAFFTTLCVAAMSLVISALALPAVFKWGAQRGRLILVMVCGAGGAIIAGLLITVRFSDMPLSAMPGEGQAGFLLSNGLLIAGILLATALVTALSYGLSCRIYQKKEF